MRRLSFLGVGIFCCLMQLAGQTAIGQESDQETVERAAGVILANLVIKNMSCARVVSPTERKNYSAEYIKEVKILSYKILDKMEYATMNPSVSDTLKSAFLYGAKKMAEDLAAANRIKIDGQFVHFDCGNPVHFEELREVYEGLESSGSSASQ
jgi:hypothetical protein